MPLVNRFVPIERERSPLRMATSNQQNVVQHDNPQLIFNMLKDSIPIFDGYSNNLSTFLRKSTEFYNALPISYKGHALTFIKSRLQGEPAEFIELTNAITIEHLSAISTTIFKDYQTKENLTRQLFDIHSPDYSVLHSNICNKLHELREFARLNYPPEIAPAMITTP
ncbi:unnamed protein product [Acanthoscelides obtectus]|uniref:Uncharacterized protein n=1 Tax=Acanthoscelides obtectus TaxID=200917 RepID=A0A9P0KAC6_ACAOB|nr:unnamed protein product [Acanthoscelides obtectus]CAK1633448.1 hypothetical protein AOBTE_LOCUS8143 [Acanthoscelides obtectus]